ncbi:MAG TPA: LysE family transporter, partial [Bordetella sp.]|nr:LysE family transporter [Bordetella sp.]
DMWRYFRRGLITDLANPQTVLFFASIFSVTLRPDTPAWAKLAAWLGLVGASVLWRVLLCQVFSRAAMRRVYARCQRTLECLAGAGLALFGLRLVYEGWARR